MLGVTVVFNSIDIDECTENPNQCGLNAVCQNLDGSFSCTCSTGYTGDGQVCTSKFYSFSAQERLLMRVSGKNMELGKIVKFCIKRGIDKKRVIDLMHNDVIW